MKIIKQGIPKEELKAILNKTKRFECRTCGCVFEADGDEYIHSTYIRTVQGNDPLYYCKCPNCNSYRVNEVKMR